MNAFFVPLVLSCTGGAGPSATVFFKRLINFDHRLSRIEVCLRFAAHTVKVSKVKLGRH